MSGWILTPIPRPEATVHLICLPYAGGSAAVFRTWKDRLPSWIEVSCVQLPGRSSRLSEHPYTQLPALAENLGAALLPHLTRPFALFGHSMGALLGFELARYLRQAAGLSPVHLFASAHRAPHCPRSNPITHKWPDDEFIEYLRALGGTPPELLEGPELLNLVLPTLRADFEACETYVYREEEPLACPITAMGGAADDEVQQDQLTAWQAETTEAFSFRLFAGNHFFIHSHETQVLQTLVRQLHGQMPKVWLGGSRR